MKLPLPRGYRGLHVVDCSLISGLRVVVAGNSVTSVDPELFKERHLTPSQQQLINSPTRQVSCGFSTE